MELPSFVMCSGLGTVKEEPDSEPSSHGSDPLEETMIEIKKEWPDSYTSDCSSPMREGSDTQENVDPIETYIGYRDESDLLYVCYHCGLKTKALQGLRHHIQAHHGNHLRMPLAKDYSFHYKCYSNSSRKKIYFFTCPQCDFFTRRKSILQKHILGQHTNKRPLSCPHCDYRTVDHSNLSRHIKVKHMFSEARSCPSCGFKAELVRGLKQHILAFHSNKKYFSCPYCSYITVRSFSLKNHIIARHTAERPRVCPHCDYGAVDSSQLNRHIRRKHIEKRPLSCNICNFITYERGTLRKHVLEHNDQPFSSLKDDVQKGENSSLKKLLEEKLEEKDLCCPLCDFKSRLPSLLVKHVIDEHSDQK